MAATTLGAWRRLGAMTHAPAAAGRSTRTAASTGTVTCRRPPKPATGRRRWRRSACDRLSWPNDSVHGPTAMRSSSARASHRHEGMELRSSSALSEEEHEELESLAPAAFDAYREEGEELFEPPARACRASGPASRSGGDQGGQPLDPARLLLRAHTSRSRELDRARGGPADHAVAVRRAQTSRRGATARDYRSSRSRCRT